MLEDAAGLERRVLVLAPTARDGEATRGLLSSIGLQVEVCASLGTLAAEAARGAAVLVLTEAALVAESLDPLLQLMEQQPPWSDIPVLILTRGGGDSERGVLALERLGNVVLLDQPVRVAMLLSAVRGAIRSRERQYRLREEIDQLEDARQALAEADRRKNEFLATLGHELRNPLAAICSAGYVLEGLPAGDPGVPSLHARIARQAQHLSRLVDDLLDVARISSGKIELRRETVDLLEVTARAVEATEELFGERGQKLVRRFPPEPVWVKGDPARLEQILANLLSNAAKYTQEEGDIDLTVERETDEVVIRVRDSGIGISPEMLPRVFDLFAQAERSRGRAAGGLGIGLSLVRTLVLLHGGTISVDSPGVNLGSEFTARLPAAPAPPSAPEAFSAPEPSSPDLRVLVVDDNRDAGESLGDLLHLWGYPHRLARGGAQALALVAEFHPDVVLLDLHMPGMSGYEVAEQLAADPRRPAYRVIALTGYGQEQDRRRTAASGFDAHLTKPVDPDALHALLHAPAGIPAGSR